MKAKNQAKNRLLAENSEKPKKARKKGGSGRPFAKGRSGNPGGRPRARETNELIRELFNLKGEDIVKRLFALCKVKDKRIQLAAINSILDRVMGKPMQAMEVTNIKAPMTEEQIVGELRKKLIKRNPRLVEQIAKALETG